MKRSSGGSQLAWAGASITETHFSGQPVRRASHLYEWRPSSAPRPPPTLLRTKSWPTLPVGLQLLSQGIPLSLCLSFSLGPPFAHRLSLSPLSWGPHWSRLLQADPSPTSSLHSPVTLAQPLVADAS